MSLIQRSGLKQPTRSKQPIAATEFQRVLERFPESQLSYPTISLSPSMLCEKTIPEIVAQYYSTESNDTDWKLAIYSNHGDGAAKVIQEYLFRAGVLECGATRFSEQTIYCPELGVKGRLDGILYPDRLKYLGTVRTPQDFPLFPVFDEPENRVILEIKETNDFQFGGIRSPEDIPEKFQWAQCLYQKITGMKTTCFLYVNRDSLALKTMFWSSNSALEEKVVDKCRSAWTHIRNRTVPTKQGTISLEQYLAEAS